jgi:hypothetical protein
MMWLGKLFFDADEQEWRISIGEKMYETFSGIEFGIHIQDRYIEAFLEEDYTGWIITLEEEITFELRLVEEYNVRILSRELVPAFNLPF